MRKEKAEKIIIVFTVISALVAFISAFFSLLLPLYLSKKFNTDARNAGSIGIIGGADGPTAVFVSGKSSFPLLTVISVLLAIPGIIYLVVAKYREKHN
ncbi:MAG: sodium ion-translocating decarboxylase subunit beta [Clostridiaceae bacterium]|nr:sodium ion-translocating decarboxylase subunit beta [Clostridiaceae bacterium]